MICDEEYHPNYDHRNISPELESFFIRAFTRKPTLRYYLHEIKEDPLFRHLPWARIAAGTSTLPPLVPPKKGMTPRLRQLSDAPLFLEEEIQKFFPNKPYPADCNPIPEFDYVSREMMVPMPSPFDDAGFQTAELHAPSVPAAIPSPPGRIDPPVQSEPSLARLSVPEVNHDDNPEELRMSLQQRMDRLTMPRVAPISGLPMSAYSGEAPSGSGHIFKWLKMKLKKADTQEGAERGPVV